MLRVRGSDRVNTGLTRALRVPWHVSYGGQGNLVSGSIQQKEAFLCVVKDCSTGNQYLLAFQIKVAPSLSVSTLYVIVKPKPES